MAWWIPLMMAAASQMQKNGQQETAKNNRLKYYGGGDRDSGMNLSQSSSLLTSVFGIDEKKGAKKQSDNLGLDKVNETGMGSRLSLEDVGGSGYEEGLWNGGW